MLLLGDVFHHALNVGADGLIGDLLQEVGFTLTLGDRV